MTTDRCPRCESKTCRAEPTCAEFLVSHPLPPYLPDDDRKVVAMELTRQEFQLLWQERDNPQWTDVRYDGHDPLAIFIRAVLRRHLGLP